MGKLNYFNQERNSASNLLLFSNITRFNGLKMVICMETLYPKGIEALHETNFRSNLLEFNFKAALVRKYLLANIDFSLLVSYPWFLVIEFVLFTIL